MNKGCKPIVIILSVILITVFILCYFVGNPGEAGSISIIGGADGPTAIFISYKYNNYYLLIPLLLILIGLVCFIFSKSGKQRSTHIKHKSNTDTNEN